MSATRRVVPPLTAPYDPHHPQNCAHPEHYPPAMRVFQTGLWEHTCPHCGLLTRFRIPKPGILGYPVHPIATLASE